jgi:alkanesulfonate monooxygenase SsuD/methylene tetrahydromethanopterin reductase-like flavin-dependent oxidoreductase (luciferase family)
MPAATRCPELALEVWGADHRALLDTARLAEELGFTALYYGESPHGLNLETASVLATVAARTTRLRIGPVITNLLPGYRSFPLFVRQVHALATLSDGRFDLRTGTGAHTEWARQWWEPVGVPYPGRAARRQVLRQWLAELDRLWSDPTAPLLGGPGLARVARPPVTIAASGDRSLAVAAALADVWEVSFLGPTQFRDRSARFDRLAGARAVRVRRSVELDVVTAGTETARRELTARFLAERGDGGPAALERALTGTAEQLAARLDAYGRAGVDQLLLAAVDPHDRSTWRTVAEAAALCSRQ